MSEAGAFQIQDKRFSLVAPRVVIIASQWHEGIVNLLVNDAVRVPYDMANIQAEIIHVPGCYELPQAASMVIRQQNLQDLDAATNLGLICFGCVVKGQTPHFDFIASAAANSIEQLACETSVPVMFGVLTTHTVNQAADRANGTHSRKGEEIAYALLEMLQLKQDLHS